MKYSYGRRGRGVSGLAIVIVILSIVAALGVIYFGWTSNFLVDGLAMLAYLVGGGLVLLAGLTVAYWANNRA